MSKLCHNLSDEFTRAATVLNAWMKVPGLVPQADIIEGLKAKALQPKAAAVDDIVVVD